MSALRIVLVLWGGLSLVLGLLMPPGDGDLWWQRWLGDRILQTHQLPTALGPETFTAAGAPWIPQEWLLGILVAVAMRSGLFVALKLIMALAPIAILLSIYVRARKVASAEAIAIVVLFCGIAIQSSFGVRAQVLGWTCFAAFLLFLDRKDRWYYLTVPIVVVWANVHASAMLAPVFLVARLVGATADRGLGGLRNNRDLFILPLTAIALCCTPLGWHLPAYAVALSVNPIRQYIQEWQPAGLTEPDFLFGPLPLALLIAIGGVRIAWRDKAASLPVVMLFAATLLARRNEALFAIAAAPLAAAAVDVRFPRLRGASFRLEGIERFGIVAACVAFVITGFAFATMRRDAPPTLPTAAIANLARGSGEKRLFCEDFSDCSIALQYPNIRVFMDGRCDPYPLAVWKAYVSAIQVRPGWGTMLNRYGVNAVVAPLASPIAVAIGMDKRWHATFRDRSFVLYERV